MKKIKEKYSAFKFSFGVFIIVFLTGFLYTLVLDTIFTPVSCVVVLLISGSILLSHFIVSDAGKKESYSKALSDLENKLYFYEIRFKESTEKKVDLKLDLMVKQTIINDAKTKISNLKESQSEEYEKLKDLEIKLAEIQKLYADKKNEAAYYKNLSILFEYDVRKYRRLASCYKVEYKIKMGPDLFDYCPELNGNCPGKKIKSAFETTPVKKRKKSAAVRKKKKKIIIPEADGKLSSVIKGTAPVPADRR